jgi:hypothetical protein
VYALTTALSTVTRVPAYPFYRALSAPRVGRHILSRPAIQSVLCVGTASRRCRRWGRSKNERRPIMNETPFVNSPLRRRYNEILARNSHQGPKRAFLWQSLLLGGSTHRRDTSRTYQEDVRVGLVNDSAYSRCRGRGISIRKRGK